MKIYLAICLAKLDNYFKIEKKKILHTNEWARVFRKLPGSTTSIHEACGVPRDWPRQSNQWKCMGVQHLAVYISGLTGGENGV